jgi:taurine transport system substrate-binding protein
MKAYCVLLKIFVIFILAGVFSGCSKKDEDKIELNVGYYPGWPCTFQAGQAKGWFEEDMGVSVNFIEFDTPSQMATAIVSGDLDMGYSMGSIPFTIGVTQDIPYSLVGVAVSYLDNDNCVARSGSGINSPADLKGKRIGVPFGATSHYNLLKIMERFGLKSDDVELFDMAPADIAAAMKRGDLDCGSAWEPAVSAMLEDGHLIVSSEEKREWNLKVFDIIVAGDDFSKKYPELITNFLSVVDKSTHYYLNNKDECHELIADVAGISIEQTADIMGKMKFLTREEQLDDEWMGTKNNPGEAVNFLHDVADFLMKEGELSRVLEDYSSKVDTSFYESVK